MFFTTACGFILASGPPLQLNYRAEEIEPGGLGQWANVCL